MYARNITELCHEILMELEHIFILRNMPCKVSYGISCMFLFHLHRDTSPLCHERIKFDIYVRHDIMWAFFVLWCPVMCNMLCPTKPGARRTYTSPRGGSMCEYMGRVWRSTTYPTLPIVEKHPRSCKVYES